MISHLAPLHKLWNPAILDGRTWIYMEKMEYISHMTQNTLFMIQNSLPRTQSTQFAIQMTQTTLVHGIYGDGQKSHNMRLENMILVQLKIEERQTTCGGLSPCHLVTLSPG